MPLTIDQLKALRFGYLAGTDIVRWASPNLLIKQDIIDDTCLQNGVDLATAEVESALINRYDILKELALKVPTQGTAAATIDAGAVNAIAIADPGTKYLTAPVVALTGGAGAGATATATIDANGILQAINITAGGAGYTSAPVVTLTGGLASDPRAQVCVKIVSIKAVENILGNSQNVSEFMMNLFRWAKNELLAIRNQQSNLPLNPVPVKTNPDTGKPFPYPESDAQLVRSTFKTLG